MIRIIRYITKILFIRIRLYDTDNVCKIKEYKITLILRNMNAFI